MTDTALAPASLLTEIEEELQGKFKTEGNAARVPSTARGSVGSDRLDQLVLSDEERGKMPLTKDKYLVRENADLVRWERETRKFLRKLSPRHAHRIAAVMVYEWATGIKIADLMAAGGTAAPDLRKINEVLTFYFGKGRMTYIAGRKVSNCRDVPIGWYVRRHRPMTLTLYAEYLEGSLYP